jgi:hypothetical protein
VHARVTVPACRGNREGVHLVSLLVGSETLLLALLSLLVVGLLRSHAEILRRLEERGEPLPAAPPRQAHGSPAAPLRGTTPGGDARLLALGNGAQDTLLAFLSGGCSSCTALLDTIEDAQPLLPARTRLVVVAKDAPLERLRRFRVAARRCDVVMSSAAWSDYAVPGSPYFVLVRDGRIAGEGSAAAWPQVASLIVDALDDRDAGRRVDVQLAAAGIAEGHASLRPTGTGAP